MRQRSRLSVTSKWGHQTSSCSSAVSEKQTPGSVFWWLQLSVIELVDAGGEAGTIRMDTAQRGVLIVTTGCQWLHRDHEQSQQLLTWNDRTGKSRIPTCLSCWTQPVHKTWWGQVVVCWLAFSHLYCRCKQQNSVWLLQYCRWWHVCKLGCCRHIQTCQHC